MQPFFFFFVQDREWHTFLLFEMRSAWYGIRLTRPNIHDIVTCHYTFYTMHMCAIFIFIHTTFVAIPVTVNILG